MTELHSLALKWGTDKALYYADFYNELLKDRRESTKKVLEFGIGYPELMSEPAARAGITDYRTGASLFMWEEYFPNAQIYALDNNPATLINQGRIKSFWCDQSRSETYPRTEIGWDFDLIIEDGSHFKSDQILCAVELAPQIAMDGIYIVEDAPPYDDAFLAELADRVGDGFKFKAHDFNDNPLDPARLITVRR